MSLRILPFLVWFGFGFAGQYAALQLQSRGLASNTATNLAFLAFLLGALAALKLSQSVRRHDDISN